MFEEGLVQMPGTSAHRWEVHLCVGQPFEAHRMVGLTTWGVQTLSDYSMHENATDCIMSVMFLHFFITPKPAEELLQANNFRLTHSLHYPAHILSSVD